MRRCLAVSGIVLPLSGVLMGCAENRLSMADDVGIQRESSTIPRVVANQDAIVIDVCQVRKPVHGCQLAVYELAPYESWEVCADRDPIHRQPVAERICQLRIDRFEGKRDRIYSKFAVHLCAADGTETVVGAPTHVTDMREAAKREFPFPTAKSKKGLQVQMVDDAIALGVQHAALNVSMPGFVDLKGDASSHAYEMDGETFHFHAGAVSGLDGQVKPLSDAGMVVSFILLAHYGANADLNRILIHPSYDSAAPNHLGAFNTTNAEGVKYYKAIIEFLVDRYTREDRAHGRGVNFIVGNEVNSHWYWHNMGAVSMEDFAAAYLRSVRLMSTAARKIYANARVYVSLEHHWGIRYQNDPDKAFGGKGFVDLFNRSARAEGNFDWHVAFHPYPENLRDPRTWNDKTAEPRADSPRITFKNLEQLPAYLSREELRLHGEPRRIILSEQGFDTMDDPMGEQWQAAAYCYAYYKTASLAGIDSFILHRHVDHKLEGGLRLGLWTRKETGYADPDRKKLIYDVFLKADTPAWAEVSAFALPIVGAARWEDIMK